MRLRRAGQWAPSVLLTSVTTVLGSTARESKAVPRVHAILFARRAAAAGTS